MNECRTVEIESQGVLLDGEWLIPEDAQTVLVLAHGAGAGYRHANMQSIATALAEHKIATLRFNFPYMQAGKRRTDNPQVACAAISSAFATATEETQLPVIAGGHSFGGRMTSLAAAQGLIEPCGLIFFSFPLHAPKKPDRKRAMHLPDILVPMLFLSGTRDDLAERVLLQTVVDELPSAQVHWLETGNHSYVVLKRTRQNPMPIFAEIGSAAAAFVASIL